MTFEAPTPDLLGLDDNWPRPGWVVLDAARSHQFSGEVELDTFPRLRVYLDRGEIYLAERVSDPPLGVRLVAAGVVTAAELEQGAIRIGDAEHLGRLFERAPSIDRDAVMAALDLMNDEAVGWAANQLVRGVITTGYRHHLSAVHRWHRTVTWAPGASVAESLPPPPPDAMPVPGPSAWLPLGDVEQLDDEVRIEWAQSSWLGERPVAPSRPAAPTVAERIDVAPIAPRPTGFPPPAPTAGRDPGDAFELIWPTGEIDEQFLGGPLSEVPLPGEPLSDVDPVVAATAAAPGFPATPGADAMTVQLRPLAAVPDLAEATIAGPVSDDVVLAIQRAIAAIGSEPIEREPFADAHPGARRAATTVVAPPAPAPTASSVAVAAYVDMSVATPADAVATEQPQQPTQPAEVAPAPRLPDRPDVAGGADSAAGRAESTATDERRSALKRLISGLRRR